MDPTRLIAKLINGKSNKMTVKPNLAVARLRSTVKSQSDTSSTTPNNQSKLKKDGRAKRKPETKYINGGITFEAPKKEVKSSSSSPYVKSEHSISYSKAKKSDSNGNESKVKEEEFTFQPGNTDDEEMEEVDPSFLYRDIIADRDDNDENMAPLFWDVYSKKNDLPKTSSFTPSPFFTHLDRVKLEPGLEYDDSNYSDCNDLQTNTGDSLILFQLPQILLSRKDGALGKLRVYNSGRLELLETKTGLVFDLQHVSCNNNISNCDVNKSELSANNSSDFGTSIWREAVVFSDRQLACLGSIENSNIMLVRPQLDQFINL